MGSEMEKLSLFVDDEDRENEGDFICAAACIARNCQLYGANGRGLICTYRRRAKARELELDPHGQKIQPSPCSIHH